MVQKKALWVSAFGPEDVESAANRLRKISRGLSRAGVEVTWAYAPDEKRASVREPNWHTIPLPVTRPAPKDGRLKGGLKRVALLILYFWVVCRWVWANPSGKVIVSVPPTWLYALIPPLSFFWPENTVIEYRDPVVNEKINPRSSGFYRRVRAMESFALKRAGLVVLVAPDILHYLPASPRRLACIYSGFDPDDCKGIEKGMEPGLVVYGGTFYAGRTPTELVWAFNDFLKADGQRDRFRFRFYAKFEREDDELELKALISRLGLEDFFVIFPLISREKFFRELRRAEFSLIITHSEGSEYAIPGKIFDYLSVPAKMMVISSDKALHHFFIEFSLGGFTMPTKRAGILEGLRRMEASRPFSLPIELDEKGEKLSCLEQGRRLADAMFTEAKT